MVDWFAVGTRSVCALKNDTWTIGITDQTASRSYELVSTHLLDMVLDGGC